MKPSILLLPIMFLSLSCGCGPKDTSYKVNPGAPPSSVPLAQPAITQEMADRVQLGQTLDEARIILGSAGTQIQREVKRIQGITRFAWRNADGSYLILDIKDNEICMKKWYAKKARR